MSLETKYVSMLKGLFPKGRLWTFPPGGKLEALLTGIAQELIRVEGRIAKVLLESDPRTTDEMLEDWEECYGLPGECGELAASTAERRTQLTAKVTSQGNQSKQSYVDIAAAIGYEITVSDITEFRHFRAEDECEAELNDDSGWPHTFAISVDEFTERFFRADEGEAEDRLSEYGDDLFECLIEDAKPAHSVVFFQYG